MRRFAENRVESMELARVAKLLLGTAGKNPYYRDGHPIRNFKELKDNLDKFTKHEALWVASWIEYLGDVKTAARIRQTPDRFKEIINARYAELRPFAT